MPRRPRPPSRGPSSRRAVPFPRPGDRSGHGAQSALDALVHERSGKLDEDARAGASALSRRSRSAD